jgi:multiple sugar transport system substrate-binding protein
MLRFAPARSRLPGGVPRTVIRLGDHAVTAFAPLNRRSFLNTAAAGLSAATVLGRAGRALAAEPINFATWSAAVDAVKSHIAAFEAKTGVKVNYTNSPWAQYRETMITSTHFS